MLSTSHARTCCDDVPAEESSTPRSATVGRRVPSSRVNVAADGRPYVAGAGGRLGCAGALHGLYGMSRYRADGAANPAKLVLGFGNLSLSSIRRGIAPIGGVLNNYRHQLGGR